MSGPPVVVRDRMLDDLPVLVGLLVEQHPVSSYPVRWPLPIPVEEFLVRPEEWRAWVAEIDGAVVGHVVVGHPGDLASQFATATGTDRLAMVSVLFTALAARGRGVGALLLETAVEWIRARGDVPVLDVVPVHAAAARMYAERGWLEVGRVRLAWLGPEVPDVLLLALPPYPSRSSTWA